MYHIDDLVQECSNHSALAMELLQSVLRKTIDMIALKLIASSDNGRTRYWTPGSLHTGGHI